MDTSVISNLLYGLQKASQTGRSLSGREVEVLELAAAGLSNKEVAQDLEITDQTVKNHVTSILRKLDVNDRTHAVTIALSKGWISNPIPTDWKVYS